MSGTDWLVLAGGAAAVAWVNWYFFVAGRGPASAASANRNAEVQEITIAVRGGYAPAAVRVRRGAPLRLHFDRQETSGCSEEVVLPAFNIRKFLPAHQTTTIELRPDTAGTFEFTCGMGMLRGRLIVE